jgi:hypothetical protein
MDLDNTPKIRVVVRKRPLTKKELRKQDSDNLLIKSSNSLVV